MLWCDEQALNAAAYIAAIDRTKISYSILPFFDHNVKHLFVKKTIKAEIIDLAVIILSCKAASFRLITELRKQRSRRAQVPLRE